MAKRIGNVQTPDYSGVSDIINLRQHKNYVEQDIFPTPDNDVLSGLRFDGSSYLLSAFGSPTNNNIWTFSFWLKDTALSGGFIPIMEAYTGGNDQYCTIALNGNKVRLVQDEGSGGVIIQDSVNILRDSNSWYHVNVLFDNTSSSTLPQKYKIYINGIDRTSTNTTISTETPYINSSGRSVKISGRWTGSAALSGYLANIHFIDGQALDPSHFGYSDRETGQWKPKKYSGTYGGNGFYLPLEKTNSIAELGLDKKYKTIGNELVTNGTFDSDLSGWSVTTAGITWSNGKARASASGQKIYQYISGLDSSKTYLVTVDLQTESAGYVILDIGTTNGALDIGRLAILGETAKKGLSTTFTGQSAVYLELESSSIPSGYVYWDNISLKQVEGVGNNWDVIGFENNDSTVDSPQNTFATLNPLNKDSDLTISNGNLQVTSSTSASHSNVLCTMHSVGQNTFYIELTFSVALAGSTAFAFYLAGPSYVVTNTHPVSTSSGAWGFYASTGGTVMSNGSVSFSISNPATNSILQLVYNSSTGDGWFGINNVFYDSSGGTTGNPSSGTNPTFTNLPNNLTVGVDVIGSQTLVLNCGQDPTFAGNKTATTTYTDANGIGSFYYEPPEGALALCTRNLPNPDIAKPVDYFKPVLYTGDFPNTKTVNVGFNPDLIWLKSRTQTYSHGLWDTIRTVNGYEQISTNTNNAQATSGDEISLITNGFRIDTGQAYNEAGQGSNNMVAWCWKAGGAPSGDGVAMVDGSATTCTAVATAASNAGASNVITPTRMSVNTKAGFSIIKYTGTGSAATVPHGLSTPPEMIICKNIDSTLGDAWRVWHIGLSGPNYRLVLNETKSEGSSSTLWGNVFPTSNYFSLDTDSRYNTSNEDHIAYCWHSVASYSAFGSYTGNGSADGPFVYTGFKPAWIMCKSVNVTGNNWVIRDSVRDGYNPNNLALLANTFDFEPGATWNPIDILSNGFKIRGTGTDVNSTSETYIYAAFAEQSIGFTNSR